MKFQTYLKTALALLAFSATSAVAVPYSIQASGLPEYMSQGHYQGSFDGTSLLPQGFFIINSLQFSFTFMDDHETAQFTKISSESTKPVTTRQEINPTTIVETTTKTTTTKWIGKGEQESVALTFGALSFQNATSAIDINETKTQLESIPVVEYRRTDNKTLACNKDVWSKAVDTKCQQITKQLVTTYKTYRNGIDYTGHVAFYGSLMDYSPARMSLMLNKKLNFGLDVLGDIDLVDATLDLDISAPGFNNTVDVPEPGSVMLFGIALLGMAGIRRKQRR